MCKVIRTSYSLVQWLAKALGACWNGNPKEFYSTIREGNVCFVAQRCSNVPGHFLEVVVYGGGTRCSFIFIPKGEEGDWWQRIARALWEIVSEG